MSDTFTSDDMTDDDEGTPAVRQLREALKRSQAENAEGEAAKRELAFLKAGVDTSNPVGALFAKAYEGDLTAEAIKAEAATIPGLIGPAQAAPENGEETDVNEDASQTRERAALAADSKIAGEQPPVVSLEAMYDDFHGLMKQGKSREEASVAVIGQIIAEGAKGNPRFAYDPTEWAAKAAAERGGLL